MADRSYSQAFSTDVGSHYSIRNRQPNRQER